MVSFDFYASAGYALELLAQSEYHRQRSLGKYFRVEILPALWCGQARFYLTPEGIPTALVTWAWWNLDVERDIHATGRDGSTARAAGSAVDGHVGYEVGSPTSPGGAAMLVCDFAEGSGQGVKNFSFRTAMREAALGPCLSRFREKYCKIDSEPEVIAAISVIAFVYFSALFAFELNSAASAAGTAPAAFVVFGLLR